MVAEFRYCDGDKDKEFHIGSMKKYVYEKQEQDKFLEKLITPLIKKKSLKILDACCGIGHILYYISKISPSSTFLGVDQTPYLIEEAKKLCNKIKNVSFEIDDVNNLSTKYFKKFDITINWKTASAIPYYDKLMKSLMAVTKQHIFLSSLFFDGDIDFEIKVREYKKESGRDRFNSYFNVYSYPRFEKFVFSLGAKNIKAYNFDINIDLPKPPLDQMGTYTIKLPNGKRLQISGAVLMLWKIIRIDL